MKRNPLVQTTVKTPTTDRSPNNFSLFPLAPYKFHSCKRWSPFCSCVRRRGSELRVENMCACCSSRMGFIWAPARPFFIRFPFPSRTWGIRQTPLPLPLPPSSTNPPQIPLPPPLSPSESPPRGIGKRYFTTKVATAAGATKERRRRRDRQHEARREKRKNY